MRLTRIDCGYLPLVDSAPLIVAQELKFAAQEGLDLNLVRQPSWSALRDMLALGHLDAAHMLSPMPVAMSLGLGGLPGGNAALADRRTVSVFHAPPPAQLLVGPPSRARGTGN